MKQNDKCQSKPATRQQKSNKSPLSNDQKGLHPLPEITDKAMLLRLASVQRQEAISQQQGLHGNYTIQRLLAADPTALATNPVVQPKLTVNEPGDVYEQEANRVAQQVMQQLQSTPNSPDKPPTIQRKNRSINASTGSNGAIVSPDIEDRINQVRGHGQKLPAEVGHDMEQAFQTDFSKVRIHIDREADALTGTLKARAFTTGQDIFFKKGEYRPKHFDGQMLLAHELTHIIQQTRGIQRQDFGSKHEADNPIAAEDLSPAETRLIGKDGPWLVFNRSLLRNEVITFLWDGKIIPQAYQLRSKINQVDATIELPDTHWRLPNNGFLEDDRKLYDYLKPEIMQFIQNQDRLSTLEQVLLPQWLPVVEWAHFMASKTEKTRRLKAASPYKTDIILVKADGSFLGAYAEEPTSVAYLFELLDIKPPSLIQRLLGLETVEQAHIRWLAKTNKQFNEYMLRQVEAGIPPTKAYERYPNAVLKAFQEAYISLIGFLGFQRISS